MRKVLSAVAAVCASVMAVGAASAQSAAKWGGLHIGAHIGYGWGDFDSVRIDASGTFPTGFQTGRELEGVLGGFHFGYDWQLGNIVVGIEGEYSFSDVSGSSSVASPLIAGRVSHSTTDLEWFGTVTGRVGYAFDSLLVYARAGVAWTSFETGGAVVNAAGTVLNNNLAEESRTGWTVGAGIEWMFAKNWSLRFEYNYLDFGDGAVTNNSIDARTGVNFPTRSDTSVDLHVAKVGLNLRF